MYALSEHLLESLTGHEPEGEGTESKGLIDLELLNQALLELYEYALLYKDHDEELMVLLAVGRNIFNYPEQPPSPRMTQDNREDLEKFKMLRTDYRSQLLKGLIALNKKYSGGVARIDQEIIRKSIKDKEGQTQWNKDGWHNFWESSISDIHYYVNDEEQYKDHLFEEPYVTVDYLKEKFKSLRGFLTQGKDLFLWGISLGQDGIGGLKAGTSRCWKFLNKKRVK